MKKELIGACVFAQSGGPTAVINASAAGVFLEALKNPCITKVYGAAHGVVGILNEELYDMGQEDIEELELLKTTPSSALGSARHKLKNFKDDPSEYQKILEVFKKYNIRYFFYNGGNDSMDTCNKVSKFMQESGYECRVMGIPKTVDNDLYGIDHCPGFASAAKYVATTFTELGLDTRVYNVPTITVVEIMGRNAGWLTASSALAGELGPDLIYLPEVPFSIEKFLEDVRRVYEKNNKKCLIAVSEGIKTADGKLVTEGGRGTDTFGHVQLGGTALFLEDLVRKEFGVKARAIELSLMQRCSAHIASKVDVEEAYEVGRQAVIHATNGETDKMISIQRVSKPGEAYKSEIVCADLSAAANTEKKVPLEWIINDNTYVSKEFIDYALPLIQGESQPLFVNGLPRFAKLKKVKV